MLAHTRQGSGEPLVLLHGLGGSRSIWEPVIERLAGERDVVAVDMPGFGGSAPLPEGTPPNAVNLAAAVSGLCAELGLERPHVAGNSLGGWVGLEIGRSGDAASVTAISPAGMWGRALGPRRVDSRRWARRLRPLLSTVLRTERGRRALLGTTIANPDRVPAEAGRSLILGWIDAPGYDTANHEMRSAIFDPRGYPQMPVTIAWGALDRLVMAPRPDQFPAGARYLVLPRVGHTPTWDDPELIASVLLEASSISALV